MRRVIGPSTERSLSDAAQGMVALCLVALLLSTVATASVVVPAQGLAPLRATSSGGQTSHGSGHTRRSQFPTGTIRTFSIPTANGTCNAIHLNIAAGPDGNLWFTELAGNSIGLIAP